MNQRSIYFTVISFILLAILFSCSQPVGERLAGEWRAVDVSIEAEGDNIGREQLDALRRMEKSVVFVLNNDSTMSAVTGGSVISGFWEYDEGTGEVRILFENAGTEPTPLGKYSGGRIIKDHETGGIRIKTTYEKR
jgi:hypothetical protein